MPPSTAAVRLLSGDKEPVRVASTANLALAGLLTVDGVATEAGDRVLVKDQTDATTNGIYTASAGTWRRAADFATSRVMVAATKVAVQEGTAQGGDVWQLDTDQPDIGDDDIEFSLYLNTEIADEINAAREALVAEMDAIIATGLAAGKATQAEAEAGASNVGWMTPLRTAQAIAAQIGSNSIGQYGDGITDATDAFNDALADGNLIVPPGSYVLSDDVEIPSNRSIWIQKGATVINTGGRFTGYVPGGGNIDFRIDGKMGFLSTTTAASQNGTNGWDVNGDQHNRGCIEIGGDRIGSQADHIYIYGTGEVYSDYVWSGVPSAFYDFDAQMNRKGIALFNVNNARIDGLYVHNMHGEAVYSQAHVGSRNVQFTRLRVVNSAFDALNFNVISTSQAYVMSDNHVENAWVGIEASAGHIKNNTVDTVRAGINTGGGGSSGDMIIQGNRIRQCDDAGITISFGTTYEEFTVCDNIVRNCGTFGIVVNNIAQFTIVNNHVYNWATVSLASGICALSSTANGYINGNTVHAAGAFTSGTVLNAGTNVTVGTNITT